MNALVDRIRVSGRKAAGKIEAGPLPAKAALTADELTAAALESAALGALPGSSNHAPVEGEVLIEEVFEGGGGIESLD